MPELDRKALKEAETILAGKLSSFPDHGAADGVAIYNVRLNGAQLSALRDVAARAEAAEDRIANFEEAHAGMVQLLAEKGADLEAAEQRATRLEVLLGVETIGDKRGYCLEQDRCSCGGDVPAIRATCGNWAALSEEEA